MEYIIQIQLKPLEYLHVKILDFILYLSTNAKKGSYYVNKDTVMIADGFSSLTDYYETTSVTVLEHLTVNYTISVTGDMLVDASPYSCLTILQIK
jgi:hypothetical protein